MKCSNYYPNTTPLYSTVVCENFWWEYMYRDFYLYNVGGEVVIVDSYTNKRLSRWTGKYKQILDYAVLNGHKVK